jgi:hypothetical protein
MEAKRNKENCVRSVSIREDLGRFEAAMDQKNKVVPVRRIART